MDSAIRRSGLSLGGESRNFYEKFLESEDYRASRFEKAVLVAEILDDELRNRRRIVDLGSGSGLVKHYLEKKYQKQVLGIEIDQQVIQDPEFTLVGDVCVLPLKSKSIDLAICNHLYEHIQGRNRFAGELRRVLSPGGIAYLTVGNKLQFREPHYRLPLLSWFSGPIANFYLRITGRGKDYSDINFPTFRRLRRESEQGGLKVRDITLEVLSGHPERMSRGQRITFKLLKALPVKIRALLIQCLSPQWFVILSE
jgi:SAM-dependent methyltransferase